MEYYTIKVDDGDRLDVCELCGSVIWDNDAHNLWHDILNGIAQKANRGESAWWFNQPIGGAVLGRHGTYQ